MRTLMIGRYEQLTEDQWRRVARTAKRRVAAVTGLAAEIGIGRKYRGGRPCNDAVAIRVYLPRKRKRVAKGNCVPDPFRIRLRRSDGRYDQVVIPSDVESLSDFVTTAATVRFGREHAASGLLLRWSSGDRGVRWGFVTVAHLLDGSSRRSVDVRVDKRTRFRCRRLRSAGRRSGLDAAILGIRGSADEIQRRLADAGLVPRNREPRVMSLRDVRRASGGRQRGRVFFPGGEESFRGEEVFPHGFRLGRRTLDHCIRVAVADESTFQPGTSGSTLRFGRRLASMQVGGKKPEFREGIGQSIAAILPWVRSALGESAEIVAAVPDR